MASLMGRARLMSMAELHAAEFFTPTPPLQWLSAVANVESTELGRDAIGGPRKKKHKKITKSERRVCVL